MPSGLLPLLLAPLLASPFDQGAAVELRYNGALTKAGRETDGTAVKRFSLYALVSRQKDATRQMAFILDERGGGSWHWPERFGQMSLTSDFKPATPVPLHLLYDHQGTPTLVAVQIPLFADTDKLKAGAKWTTGKEAWEVVGSEKIQDRTCWKATASTNFGRKRTVWIEAESPQVVALEERVFIGQGEEFSLTMQVESTKTLDDKQFATVLAPLQTLIRLQSDLQRVPLEAKAELSPEQLKVVADAIPKLEKEAVDTPFSHLASVIARDLKTQLQRSDEVVKLAKKFIGQAAPPFSQNSLDKVLVDSAAFQDKIVVLHFWEYQSDPLIEPYGQVGYLDFLYSKRRKLGVQVYGIAVDSRLGDAQTAPAAIRSIQKLKSFMNLAYPIIADDGKLLGKFGDPRKSGAKLPLWVVIAPDGTIAHYQVGFYKINPDEGLREVDDLLIKLIREQKAKSDAAP